MVSVLLWVMGVPVLIISTVDPIVHNSSSMFSVVLFDTIEKGTTNGLHTVEGAGLHLSA